MEMNHQRAAMNRLPDGPCQNQLIDAAAINYELRHDPTATAGRQPRHLRTGLPKDHI